MQLRKLFSGLASGASNQLGDLSALAGGQVGSPTGADQELIAASIQRARQMAEEQMRVGGQVGTAQLRERLGGASDSSREVAEQLLQQLGVQGGINQSILQAQQAGGEALMNLPFQRGAMQLQANQALFNQILGAGGPVLQAGLQERIAQPTTTQSQSGFGLDQVAQLGALVAAPFTGGASLAALPALSGGGGANSLVQRVPNSTGSFTTVDFNKFTGPFGGRGIQ